MGEHGGKKYLAWALLPTRWWKNRLGIHAGRCQLLAADAGRILHVVDRVDGGVPKAVRSYIENSPTEFTHVVLSPFQEGRPAPVWHGLDVEHHDLGTGLFNRIAAVGTTVRALMPQVVHAHSSFSGLYTRARTIPAPVVYEPHCFKHDDPHTSSVKRAVYRGVEKALARRTWKFGTLTSHEEKLVRALRPAATCVAIPNLPTVATRSTTHDALDRQETPVISMVGRIARQKDPAFFLDVAAALRARVPSVGFQWIGDGEPELRRQLEQAGIVVTGWLDNMEVAGALAASTVYMHSAAYEGFPLSILDAAAQGVPIAARSINALEDSGLLQAADAEGVARLVAAILDDAGTRELALEANRTLLARMNRSTLHTALRDLYDLKGPER
ncbi:glycosyltransferase [Paenarthrobacter sp. TE4293]|uniref:glycosyltransferase n=1 Tax=Paenarthrobacter sp. TE4293 TaxID=3381695 RepID=UPI003D1A80C4